MSKIKNILRDVGYCSIGAAAVIVEAGGKAVRALVRKGEKTLQDNQDTVEEIMRRARAAGEKIKEAVQDLNKKSEDAETPEVEDPVADIPAAEVPQADSPVTEVPVVDTPVAEAPVVPDVIYRAEAPIPQEAEPAEEPERPEASPNG